MSVRPSKRGTLASDLSTASLSAAMTSLARGRLLVSHGVERREEAERQDERLRDEPLIDQHRERGVHALRRLLEDVAQVSQEREVAELARGDEFVPRGALQLRDFLLARAVVRFRAGLGELRLPRFGGSEFTADQLAQRLGVRRVEQVDRIHQLQLRRVAAVLRELVLVETRERRAEALLQGVRDRATVDREIAGEDFEHVVRAANHEVVEPLGPRSRP